MIEYLGPVWTLIIPFVWNRNDCQHHPWCMVSSWLEFASTKCSNPFIRSQWCTLTSWNNLYKNLDVLFRNLNECLSWDWISSVHSQTRRMVRFHVLAQRIEKLYHQISSWSRTVLESESRWTQARKGKSVSQKYLGMCLHHLLKDLLFLQIGQLFWICWEHFSFVTFWFLDLILLTSVDST